jgi:hypothetical protein
MIALSLIVYLGLTFFLILPFVLRYLFVLRQERHAEENIFSDLPTQHG